MFSVKQFMEEGFKFIIPPPKYHPFPNILPIVDSSFLSDKMAADSPYHRLPEDNRPSMDSTPGDDQRLIDSDPLYDDDEPAPPKKGTFNFKLSYHPTFYLRLLALCLFISAFGIFTAAASRHSNAIPSTAFLSIAILRNIVVLYFHLVGHSLIRIHIEIVGRTTSTSNSQPKKWRPSVLHRRLVQVAIDWILIGILIATTITAKFGEHRWYYWNRNTLVLPACILSWIALPIYALSTIDMGKPSRLKVANAVAFDTSKEKEDAGETVLPRTYRDVEDVEASGGLQGDMTRKTGADSPPII